MQNLRIEWMGLVWLGFLASQACGGTTGDSPTASNGTGAVSGSSAVGGSGTGALSTGGIPVAGSSGNYSGGRPPTGGNANITGGFTQFGGYSTQGGYPLFGGYPPTGGAAYLSGGTAPTGGAVNPTGGTATSTGGTTNSMGGWATGGVPATLPPNGASCICALADIVVTVGSWLPVLCKSDNPNECTLQKAYCGQTCAGDPGCGANCVTGDFTYPFTDADTYSYGSCAVIIRCPKP
jgi:hypothetical protein